MADTIKIPGMGEVKKTYVFIGLGAVVVAAGIYYWRQRNAPATTADAGSGEIDEATGFPYGSPEDLAALAAQQGQPTYEPGPLPVSGGGSTPVYTYPSGQFATNDAWAQAAQDYLVNQAEVSAATAADGIRVYLAGQSMTPAQQHVAEMAVAFVGKPPIAGPNGYPPNMKTIPAPTTIKLATPRLSRSGGGRLGTTVKLTWTASPHAGYYTLYRNGVAIAPVHGTSYSYKERTRSVSWRVQARGAAGTPYTKSDQSNNVTVS